MFPERTDQMGPGPDWLDLDEYWVYPDEEWFDPDPEWIGSDHEWADHAQEVYDYPVASRARLGLGFVMTCAILVCTVLSLFLFRATANAHYPVIQDDSPSSKTASGMENGDAQEEAVPKPQNTEEENVSETTCAVSNRFPPAVRQWCDLITQYANKRGLPPDLVAALIWQESGGNSTAYSRSGAVGLMQVMPRDGLAASFMCANGPCFSSRPTIEELKDPEFNIKYGTKMLAGLLNRYGSVRDALKFYGPMDVGYYYADKVLGLFQRYGQQSP